MLDRGFVLDQGKEALATTVLDAEPDVISKMPQDSPWPFLLTLAMSAAFAGMLAQLWWGMAVATVGVALCISFWLWPRRRLLQIAKIGQR
jgi:cytochrome c oxidase subunit 1/cytochrome c oxidase subunit I+III